jgi:cystathionine beta-lyase/cystathionine gamma-synthase
VSTFVTDVPQPATSLGGVESLVEHRVNADPKENPLLVRLSIGVEEVVEVLFIVCSC